MVLLTARFVKESYGHVKPYSVETGTMRVKKCWIRLYNFNSSLSLWCFYSQFGILDLFGICNLVLGISRSRGPLPLTARWQHKPRWDAATPIQGCLIATAPPGRNPKSQAPNTKQAPNSKDRNSKRAGAWPGGFQSATALFASGRFGHWDLGFRICLVLGIWDLKSYVENQ